MPTSPKEGLDPQIAALRQTLPDLGKPVSRSQIKTVREAQAYASAGFTVAKAKAFSSTSPASNRWASAAYNYYLAYGAMGGVSYMLPYLVKADAFAAKARGTKASEPPAYSPGEPKSKGSTQPMTADEAAYKAPLSSTSQAGFPIWALIPAILGAYFLLGKKGKGGKRGRRRGRKSAARWM